MKSRRNPRAPVRALLLLCVLGPVLFLSACSVSQHQLPRVSVVAELQPDGALRIAEEVTYELGAGVRSISHALEVLYPYPARITDVSASARLADGRRVQFVQRDHAEVGDTAALVARPADKIHLLLTLYHPFTPPNAASSVAVVTVTYSYVLRDVARRYSDAGTFIWRPLGFRGWDVPISQWSARIALPIRAEDRLDVALLHAPPGAVLTRLSDGITLSGRSVRAGARAAIRVDFAPEILVHMPVMPGEPLADLRAAARQIEIRSALLGYGWLALCLLASLGLAAWFHHRKGIHVPSAAALGVTAPAELSTLVPLAGGVGLRDVTAMLLHLVHRNHLALLPPDSGLPLTRETMDQARLIRLPAPRDKLLDGEFFLIHWFVDTLGDGKAVTMEQIRRVPRATFEGDYRVWRQLVNEQIAQRPWFEEMGKRRKALAALGVGLLLGTPAILAMGGLPVASLGVPIGLMTIAYARRMRHRTASAALEVKRWRSLRAQLQAGRVQGATTLAQWERILLYAHAMGIGQKAAMAFQAAVAAEVKGEAPAWPDAREATFMAWPLLDYPGHLARWFELLCGAIVPVR